MYEYVIDTVEMVTRSYRWVPIIEPGEVIARRAAQGWRFCQIYAPPSASGVNASLQIIFERPVTGPRDAINSDLPGDNQWPRR